MESYRKSGAWNDGSESSSILESEQSSATSGYSARHLSMMDLLKIGGRDSCTLACDEMEWSSVSISVGLSLNGLTGGGRSDR